MSIARGILSGYLKEGLEQLLNNMPSNSNTGGLGKASEDMEDIINDFKRNQVDRITKEKQQKILSRMLDSQKSLTKKDFSNNRKSESYSGNISHESPTQLSDDKGQNELLLINAMESALKEGHSNEYQELIKLLETKEDLSLEKKESLAEDLMMFKANPSWPSTVDYGCLNMCKGAIKGMTIGEINSFCMMRCSINKE